MTKRRRHPDDERLPVVTRPAVDADEVPDWLHRTWGEVSIAVHGQLYDAAALPALVAVDEADVVLGVLSFVVEGDGMELVSCVADPPGRGVGRVLVSAAADLARAQALGRLRCTTTNDNLPALAFWQSLGFALVGLRRGAVTAARQLKPSIPHYGHRGLPIRDELDLELEL